jgi:single-strand DNA-binding protein
MTTLRNSVKLIGRPGQDPEVKALANNRKMARFRLATNEYYTNAKGERVSDTQWHTLIAWGKTADLVENLVKKGKEVAIEGKLTSRSWEDKDGVKRQVVEVVVNEVQILEKTAVATESEA